MSNKQMAKLNSQIDTDVAPSTSTPDGSMAAPVLEGIFEHGYGVIPKVAMVDPELPLQSKAIYAYICSLTGKGKDGEDKIAYFSRARIKNDLNITESRYYRYLAPLLEAGYIEIIQKTSSVNSGFFKQNRYIVKSLPSKYLQKPKDPTQKKKYADIRLYGIFAGGYGIIPFSVMSASDLDILSKGFYAYLAAFTGKDANAFPGRDYIIYHLNISRSTYDKLRIKLIEQDYIKVIQRRDTGKLEKNVFCLNQFTKPTDENKSPENQAPDSDCQDGSAGQEFEADQQDRGEIPNEPPQAPWPKNKGMVSENNTPWPKNRGTVIENSTPPWLKNEGTVNENNAPWPKNRGTVNENSPSPWLKNEGPVNENNEDSPWLKNPWPVEWRPVNWRPVDWGVYNNRLSNNSLFNNSNSKINDGKKEGADSEKNEIGNPLEAKIKQRIRYDDLAADWKDIRQSDDMLPVLDACVGILMEASLTTAPEFVINRNLRMPTPFVQAQMAKVGSNEVSQVLNEISRLTEPPKNPKAYLATSLLNATYTAAAGSRLADMADENWEKEHEKEGIAP